MGDLQDTANTTILKPSNYYICGLYMFNLKDSNTFDRKCSEVNLDWHWLVILTDWLHTIGQ